MATFVTGAGIGHNARGLISFDDHSAWNPVMNSWEKKQSKIESLRNAQLHILKNPVLPDGTRLNRGQIKIRRPLAGDTEPDRDLTDPYFWAAWTLSGDWR